MSADDAIHSSAPSTFQSRIVERAISARNALLANLRFQRLAASLPLTRLLAQRQARETFDLCAGFVYSQILLACVKLDVFGNLRSGPATASALAARLDLPLDAATRLLDAAVALKLVSKLGDGRYALGSRGAVIGGNPGIVKMIEHHAMLYDDLADPVALLRGEAAPGKIHRYWAYAKSAAPDALSSSEVSDYTALMSASQTLIAEDVISVYPFTRHRRLLDVGGGDGAFLRAVSARAPDLELMMFDLPAVAAKARSRFAAEGLADRAQVFGGDVFVDDLPTGADLISLIRIIHDHDDEPVKKIFAAVRKALAPGGRLIVAEPMSGSRGAETVGDAYFGFYLLAMGSGRPRPESTIIEMLRRAGFANARSVKTRMPLQTSLIVADR